jgi:hypothetical protein
MNYDRWFMSLNRDIQLEIVTEILANNDFDLEMLGLWGTGSDWQKEEFFLKYKGIGIPAAGRVR